MECKVGLLSLFIQSAKKAAHSSGEGFMEKLEIKYDMLKGLKRMQSVWYQTPIHNQIHPMSTHCHV